MGTGIPRTERRGQAWVGRPVKPARVLERLSHVDLLRALPPEEVQAVVPYVELVQFPAGQCIFTEGDAGDALYLIDQGEARLTNSRTGEEAKLGPEESFGEAAILTAEPRACTVTAETDLTAWRIRREDFERITRASPRLEAEARKLTALHHEGLGLPVVAAGEREWLHRERWLGTALRSMAARRREFAGWQKIMAVGFAIWVGLQVSGPLFVDAGETAIVEAAAAFLALLAGLAILQGACEALVLSVERLGARLQWDGYIAGTLAQILANLPEFVVLAFLVRIEPLAAFIIAIVAIYNNALVFSIYSFFLPKDRRGSYQMPAAITRAGTEVLIAGAGLTLIVGLVLLALKEETHKSELSAPDLFVIAAVLLAIFGLYVYTLIRYYSEGPEKDHPPSPHVVGHATDWRGIAGLFAIGIAGAVVGGESVSRFAEVALHSFRLPPVPTAIVLAFFGNIAELVILFKAHRRKELSIALSDVFGGVTQQMFMVVPFTLLVIGLFNLLGGGARYAIPIDFTTATLMLLLFPVFFVLLQYVEEDHTLSNLDAAAMTGIHLLLIYLLIFAGPGE